MTPALVLSRRLFGALSLAAVAGPLRAEPVPLVRPWPRRQIKLMIGLADSRSEAMAHTLAASLSARWRQPVVVDRHGTVDGVAPVEAFLATHDDHVLLLAPTDLWTVPSMPGLLSADPARDLLPVVPVAQDVVVLAAAAKSGLATLDDVLETARRRPRTLTWTSASPSPAFAFASVLREARAQLVFAPSRTSLKPLADLAEGRLDLALLPLTSAIEPARTGKCRLLAVAAPERVPAAPAVPTVTEARYPAMMTMSGHGLFGRRDMPTAARARIADDVAAALRDPTVAERLTRMGYRPSFDAPALFLVQLQREHARWIELGEPVYNVTAAQ